MLKSPFEPCIPTRGIKVPDRPESIHEIKHDGYRLIVQRDRQESRRLFTRNGFDCLGGFHLRRRSCMENGLGSYPYHEAPWRNLPNSRNPIVS